MISGTRGGGVRPGGPRIRPPRRTTTQASNADEFEYNWEKLQSALQDIHMRNASALAFEQLYRHAYKIVLKKAGDRLYDNVKDFETKWFKEKVIPPIFTHITKNLISVTFGEVPGISVVERRSIGEKFLKAIRESWEQHNTAMNMIADILMYLDRGVSQDHTRPTIFAATIGLFRDHILKQVVYLDENVSNTSVFDIFNATIIDQINMEREGDVIDKALLRNCISMLESLHETDEEHEDEKLYNTVFEPYFVRHSHHFYKEECNRLIAEADASSWLRHTQRRLHEESIRCHTAISLVSQEKIAKVVDDQLISSHLDEFMNLEGSGVRSMIDNNRIEDLNILYQLVSRVDNKKASLKRALSTRIIELGSEIEKVLRNTDFSKPKTMPTDENGAAGAGDGAEKTKAKPLNASAQQTMAAIQWVDDVLALKQRFDDLLTQCFASDLILQTAVTKSFSDFINTFDRSPEFLSLYIDHELRTGIKTKSEAEIDGVLEKAIVLLRYINEKDKFETYYQKHLARRLLQQKSESHEVETEMISRMKRELGNNFTHKFEGMFKDINLSRDITEQYARHVRGLGAVNKKQIELSVNILGGNNWPKDSLGKHTGLGGQGRVDANYPPEIKTLQDSFFSFYSKDRTGRVLTWIGGAGTADMRCVFPKIAGKTSGPLSRERRYEVTVSTYGMIILLLFNDLEEGKWLSLEEIQAQTNVTQSDLINVLTSLSVMKGTKLLLKDPPTKNHAKAGDRFTFNREFVSKAIKFKVATITAVNKVENEEEAKETNERNTETRKYIIDAAVVRIMKQRKELQHTQLMTEVIHQVSSQFKPDVPLIKSRVEDLISREYLERVEGTPAYRYVA